MNNPLVADTDFEFMTLRGDVRELAREAERQFTTEGSNPKTNPARAFMRGLMPVLKFIEKNVQKRG
jgi:hypothetical protein